jgi:hypothetical protein
MHWLIIDWGDNKSHVFAAVRQALSALGHETTVISRSGTERRPELLDAIRSRGHNALLTWQRFYPMQRDILEAVAETQIQTVFMRPTKSSG